MVSVEIYIQKAENRLFLAIFFYEIGIDMLGSGFFHAFYYDLKNKHFKIVLIIYW